MEENNDGTGENNNVNNNTNNNNADENNPVPMNNDTRPPIVDALMTYVISILHTCTDPKLVELMGRYFCYDDVKNAKHLLCDAGGATYHNRRDSEKRVEKMAHIRDIVDILRNLDRTNNIPFFVVGSIGLAGLPRINAEDISYVVVAEKMADLFGKIEVLTDAVSANTMRSTQNKEHMNSINVKNIMPYSAAINAISNREYPELKSNSPRLIPKSPTSNRMPPPRFPHPQGARPPHKVVTVGGPLPRSQFQMTPFTETNNVQLIRDRPISGTNNNNVNNPVHGASNMTVTPAASTGAHNIPGTEGTTSSAAAETSGNVPTNNPCPNDDATNARRGLAQSISYVILYLIDSMNSNPGNNPWERSREHMRTFNRRGNNRRRLEGTAQSGSTVKGAPPRVRNWHLFVSRVSQDTADEDMVAWIREQNVNIIDFERVSHDDSMYKSFKITLPISDYMTLFNPSIWPAGVCIARYVPPRSSEIK